ncbi:hypothetical protein PABG_02431 [Paracoccidioides brasiliensis Pb03]|uniref:Uncharacterized protein n=1 Tax=Paracoccidioides brasiliensis (strain Pb18) TaxID=502780 RepID=C1FYI1_PARBD|nr:uncharacterized protein PADG_00857 [Paracoccidioides brasiliensis Pb18]EEH20172.2 hypothetical protein PABG_02431 [Paracoccidioides brasiliensis Pb03]EEH44568.2 hypothetical protein PADG_00857 [Paracoccidioides brasiliensis Pb18]
MESEPQTTPETRRRLPPCQVDCKWWKKGNCFRGSECFFRHDAALAGVDALPGSRTASVAAGNSRNETTITDNPDEQCGICLETPSVFGLLVNCDHIFCLDCIRSWRSSVGNSAEDAINRTDSRVPKRTTKTCPLCRVKSEYVVPSSVYPTPPTAATAASNVASGSEIATTSSTETGESSSETRPKNEAKAKIIDKYLARLKGIPCRYFELSIQRWRELPAIENLDPNASDNRQAKFSGECLFGNECHFAHIHPITKAPYVFSKKEISLMKRANHERRSRAIRRALRRRTGRAFIVSEHRRELDRMLEALRVEEDYESSTPSDLVSPLEDDGPDALIDAGFVFYDMLVGSVPWLVESDEDELDDYF